MATCEIKWIDDHGNPTPDSNIAVGRVRCERHFEHINGRTVEFPATQWFPICTAHAHRLDKPGMQHWTFEPLPEDDGEPPTPCPDCKGNKRGGANTTDGGPDDDCSTCSATGVVVRAPKGITP